MATKIEWKIKMINIPCGPNITNFPFGGAFGHGHYPPTIQVHAEGLKI
jgi:hypothetical protein